MRSTDKLKALESEHEKAMDAYMRRLRSASMIMTGIVCLSAPIAIAATNSAIIGVIAAICALGAMGLVMGHFRRQAEKEIAYNAVRREEILDNEDLQ